MELTDFEKRLVAMRDQLAGSDAVEVMASERLLVDDHGITAADAFANVAQWGGVTLDPSLQQCYFGFGGFSSQWRTVEPYPHVRGEFKLTDLPSAAVGAAPALAWEGSSAEERNLYAQFRVIDDMPVGGMGMLAAIRVEEGVSSPEVWYYYSHFGAVKLDLDYCGYLEALLLTRGASGWQYLFAGVSLADSRLTGLAENLANMVDLFPRIFPGPDYGPIGERLAQRL
jgi:hypothetical protein